MRIVITGSHGVGKTTLVNLLLSYLNQSSQKYKLLPDAPILAFELGFPINEQTPLETEIFIFGKQLELERRAGDNYIADKGFIDLLAYVRYIFRDQPALKSVLEAVASRAVRNYDLIVYLPAGQFPIEDNKIRSTDPVFQRAIDREVLNILDGFNLPYHKLVGSPLERLEQVKKIIKSKLGRS